MCFISFTTELSAQSFSKGYLDSVKWFYKDWSSGRKDFINPLILDNTSKPQIIDNCIFEIYQNNFDKRPCKVHKMVIDTTLKNGSNPIDSIIITNQEFLSLLLKLQQSKSFTWTRDFFPGSKIIDTEQFIAAYKDTLTGGAKPTGWVFTLPLFLRNGAYSISYYLYHCDDNCSKEGLIVYKNENGHWQEFGIIFKME